MYCILMHRAAKTVSGLCTMKKKTKKQTLRLDRSDFNCEILLIHFYRLLTECFHSKQY